MDRANGTDTDIETTVSKSDADTDPTNPLKHEIPRPTAVGDASEATGVVVWYRKHFRISDQLAVARAVADADVVCPLFVFDPTFYTDSGLACDARVRFLHQAVASLDRLYAATPATTVTHPVPNSRDHLKSLRGSRFDAVNENDQTGDSSLAGADDAGLTIGYGDPVRLLARFVDAGWTVVTMATPTSRYGKQRDDRVREACGDAIEFVSGDGLVRDQEWSRQNWAEDIKSWLHSDQHSPDWTDTDTTQVSIDTGITPSLIDEAFDVTPTKQKVPTGTHKVAADRLGSFISEIRAYPEHISAPHKARKGTSGLSPFLNFGLLSVRQVHQAVTDRVPPCRGREMFTDRLVWNLHYNQKLVDWPGWTDTAVNPVFEGYNEERHDPELVQAWKQGQTGFPMVDASMRCLAETGWLNFRMRAMCASFFAHILQQPWWVGADWYHHHLIDSDVGINYTQWQSQAGLIGKPAQRVYNPRKQVRDQDPDGKWITEWIPELDPLPSEFLNRPERAPLATQNEHGIVIGADYPRPIVDFEARREAFWSRYEHHRPEAAEQLARPEIAKRASFSGGYGAAKSIAAEYGSDDDESRNVQTSLADVDGADRRSGEKPPVQYGKPAGSSTDSELDGGDNTPTPSTPKGAGRHAGEPSPDDKAAVADAGGGEADDSDTTENDKSKNNPEQTTIGGFSQSVTHD